MMDEMWYIPVLLIVIVGIGGLVIEYKRHSCHHDRAEILSGFGILMLATGVFEIAIRIGDIIGATLILVGMFISIAYGIEHIRARRIERRNQGKEDGKQTVE